MSDRAYVGVKPNGSTPVYVLVVDGVSRGRQSFFDILDHIGRALDSIRNGTPFEIIPGVELSYVDTISFAMQAVSSTRWYRGTAWNAPERAAANS